MRARKKDCSLGSGDGRKTLLKIWRESGKLVYGLMGRGAEREVGGGRRLFEENSR